MDIVHAGATGNTIEANHTNTANGSSAVWVQNSGIGRAINVNMLNNANNIPAVQITQGGTNAISRGLEVDMAAGTQAIGLAVFHDGTGWGQYINLSDAANANNGLRVDHAGTGDAIATNSSGTGWSMFNTITGNGSPMLNWQNGTGFFGTVDDLSTNGGLANLAWFNGAEGSGFVVDSIGGDGFALDGTVNTATATIGTIVSGAAFAGVQTGLGHGILVNHRGAQGRNAEFNVENPANTDPALFAVHRGQGSVINGQNQNNAITGIISVADFAYTGTDIADHVGVEGFSAPAAGWGIGLLGTGNWYGMFSQGNYGATGPKNFLIDHPTDPANKVLRHASIESNQVLNMYVGTVELDANGQATVQLPDYFGDVNKDFHYQLTPIGTPQQPYVLEEIANNQFKVAGAANTKVSWQVTAKRNDAYMQAHPELHDDVVVKVGERAGKYLQPELHGADPGQAMFPKPEVETAATTLKHTKGMRQYPALRDASIQQAERSQQNLNQVENNEEEGEAIKK
ncbi:MAG: hypothetical protein AAF570_11110 [Bacteroidota bacterium]